MTLQPPPGQGPVDPRGAFSPPPPPFGGMPPPPMGGMPPPPMFNPPMMMPPWQPPPRRGIGRTIFMVILILILFFSIILNVGLLVQVGASSGLSASNIRETTLVEGDA